MGRGGVRRWPVVVVRQQLASYPMCAREARPGAPAHSIRPRISHVISNGSAHGVRPHARGTASLRAHPRWVRRESPAVRVPASSGQGGGATLSRAEQPYFLPVHAPWPPTSQACARVLSSAQIVGYWSRQTRHVFLDHVIYPKPTAGSLSLWARGRWDAGQKKSGKRWRAKQPGIYGALHHHGRSRRWVERGIVAGNRAIGRGNKGRGAETDQRIASGWDVTSRRQKKDQGAERKGQPSGPWCAAVTHVRWPPRR